MEVYLVALDDDLLPRSETLVNSVVWETWRPGSVIHESDLWILPRMVAADRGRVVLQEDVYEPGIGIYNEALENPVRIEAEWSPPARPEHELAAVLERTNGAKIPSPTDRALEHVLLVGHEIWLQYPRSDGRVAFRAYDSAGEILGDREFPDGFPNAVSMNCHDRHLLTSAVDDGASGGVARQVFTLCAIR